MPLEETTNTPKKTQVLLQSLDTEVKVFLIELLKLEREYAYLVPPPHNEIRDHALALLRSVVK